MRLGVDFGTSFCSAAVSINGTIEHIRFGQSFQFRTAVFFPDRHVPDSDFVLTAEHLRKIDNSVALARSLYSEEYALYRARLSDIERSRKGLFSQPAEQLAQRRKLLTKPKQHTDDEVRQRTYVNIKRDWRAQQDIATSQERLSLRKASGLFGEEAVDALYSQEPGRVVQSPKSMLGFKLDAESEDVVIGSVTGILKHIRSTASRQLGVDITDVTLGHPVQFRGGAEQSSEHARQALKTAALNSGFTDIQFLAEPCAVAYGYRSTEPEHNVLIIDIGGGTTDLAYARVGGGVRTPVIHQAWGWCKGGTDIDRALSMYAAMPLFGWLDKPALPMYVYRNATNVSDLGEQRQFIRHPLTTVGTPYLSRLKTLQQPGVTVKVNHDVEQLKIALSEDVFTAQPLSYIESDLLMEATREGLVACTTRLTDSLRDFLVEVRKQLPEQSPRILMAGGTSRAPYIEQCVRDVFPDSQITHGDASYGVVIGLARVADASQPPRPKSKSQNEAAIEAERKHFMAGMLAADRVAKTYEASVTAFEAMYAVQCLLLKGTTPGQYLKVLNAQVSEAKWLNVQAGWLCEHIQFTEDDFLNALIRRDQGGKRFKSYAQIPVFLQEDGDNDDVDEDPNDGFHITGETLREECREAYDQMSELREIIDDEPTGDDIFDAIDSWSENSDEDILLRKEGQALANNLRGGWEACRKKGLALLCMANQLGDNDLDWDLAMHIMES